jgi:hypothetical protein
MGLSAAAYLAAPLRIDLISTVSRARAREFIDNPFLAQFLEPAHTAAWTAPAADSADPAALDAEPLGVLALAMLAREEALALQLIEEGAELPAAVAGEPPAAWAAAAGMPELAHALEEAADMDRLHNPGTTAFNVPWRLHSQLGVAPPRGPRSVHDAANRHFATLAARARAWHRPAAPLAPRRLWLTAPAAPARGVLARATRGLLRLL